MSWQTLQPPSYRYLILLHSSSLVNLTFLHEGTPTKGAKNARLNEPFRSTCVNERITACMMLVSPVWATTESLTGAEADSGPCSDTNSHPVPAQTASESIGQSCLAISKMKQVPVPKRYQLLPLACVLARTQRSERCRVYKF